jgi:hypothetical protein
MFGVEASMGLEGFDLRYVRHIASQYPWKFIHPSPTIRSFRKSHCFEGESTPSRGPSRSAVPCRLGQNVDSEWDGAPSLLSEGTGH